MGEEKIFSCAFSGHRRLGADFDEGRLEEAIRARIEKGAKVFYCGMAVGFDLCAAECVRKLKREFPFLTLVACIPCADQDKNFSPGQKERYARLVSACEVKVILSDAYYRGCMLRRNEYMAEKADALISYCRKNDGGTFYTVHCFERRGKPVFRV